MVSDFRNQHALRNYFTLFESTSKALRDVGTDILREDYTAGIFSHRSLWQFFIISKNNG